MNRFDRSRQILAISSAGLAGFVDATGYLSANGYFVSFMSGNTTRLAVNLAQHPARALAPVLLLGGFLAGVIAGALVAARAGEGRKPAVLALVAALLLVAAIAENAAASRNLALAAMVMAMGAINNTFQRDGEVAVGVSYMTGALVKLGQAMAARLMGRPGGGWAPHLLLWLGLAGGAVAGAVAFTHLGGSAAWIAFVWAGALALVARRISAAPPA